MVPLEETVGENRVSLAESEKSYGIDNKLVS